MQIGLIDREDGGDNNPPGPAEIPLVSEISRGCLADCLAGRHREDSSLSKFACVLWYVFFPLVLIYHSIRIYVAPCVYSYVLSNQGKYLYTRFTARSL